MERSGVRRRSALPVMAALTAALALFGTASTSGDGDQPPVCGPQPIELNPAVSHAAAEQYMLIPFEVPSGTSAVEVSYGWDNQDVVLDLGLWDPDGTSGPDAFRFWSGSRQGRIDRDMDPVVVAPDRHERTVVSGPIEPGIWHVELGLAAVDVPNLIFAELRISCPQGEPGDPLVPDRVDAGFVARDEPGWYAADFHLHGYHSSPDGPDEQEMVDLAREAGLDIIPVTEYVTPAHWDRLGQAQRDNPDVLLWPGREVVTYDGHLVVLGETPDSVEYRLGHEGTTLGDIQRATADQGALVSLAHPTLFPPETFGDTCRGCFLEAIDQVDWEATELIEVVTEGVLAEIDGVEVPNPFVDTAVALWEEQLRAGNRLTAVSGSDDKQGDRYGSTKTMVWADELSRTAVDAALRSGHAYVRGLGDRSPTIEVTATAIRPDNPSDTSAEQAMMGDTLVADSAEMAVTVFDGDGLTLALRRDGSEVERLRIRGDEFTQTFDIERDPGSGPLGTFFAIEVLDDMTVQGTELRTVIANPVFLADQPAEPIRDAPPAGFYGEDAGVQDSTADSDARTNGGTWPVIVLIVAVIAMGIGSFIIGRRLFAADSD